MTVLKQIREAWRNPLAAWTGCIFGAAVPLATYFVAHFEAGAAPWLWSIVAGGLLVSAPTVYEWALAAFQNRPKSVGFVMLLEGTMILSGIKAMAIGCLTLLVVINAVGAAACLARRDTGYKRNAVKGKRKNRQPRRQTLAA